MLKFDKGSIIETAEDLPREYPLKLNVNGREIATLVASPHELRFLVAGFLRTQGFIKNVGDIMSLGVCEEFGEARANIKGDLPERMTPVLTSGCGAGISFSLAAGSARSAAADIFFSPEAIFSQMREMSRLSERYARHGGIHSAAVSNGTRILFHAEDLGRHNTIDRLAGLALLSETDLAGCLLLTSGRVSAEMAAKAASLGVAVIASRTSPTDMAVRICNETGIGLAGYVRGDSLRIAACPERFLPDSHGKISGVTGVILAGGESKRMGSNKALLMIQDERMIEGTYCCMAQLFSEVLLVTNTPETYDFIPCRKISDIFPGMGPLGGIHSALKASGTPRIFVVACDMPTLNSVLVRNLCAEQGAFDAVVPETPDGLEPLHAIYALSGLDRIQGMLEQNERSVLTLLERAATRVIPSDVIERIDPGFTSFRNINTPEEFRELEKGLPRQS